ncbi:unnamed protein product [Eruca vesicaria subsp. sativa]|uniref:Uncharacterized protein n=1 Tax=Eruca vesicaria subsp. sativa TaxID=29727 RepID=A0ABC8LKQ8_ERUVS|nr:unnamed protein product [Eruca vesicaria subsp. sativa]
MHHISSSSSFPLYFRFEAVITSPRRHCRSSLISDIAASRSKSGKSGVIDDHEFKREDEKKDERVDMVVDMIKANHDWEEFVWEVESLPTNKLFSEEEEEDDVEDEDVTEPPVVAEKPTVVVKREKRKHHDPGVKSRKKELLCQRAAEHNSDVSGKMKTFIQGLFTSFKDMVQKEMQERFDKVDTEVANIKETITQIRAPSDALGKNTAAEIPTPSGPIGKDQGNSSQSPGTLSTLGKD